MKYPSKSIKESVKNWSRKGMNSKDKSIKMIQINTSKIIFIPPAHKKEKDT